MAQHFSRGYYAEQTRQLHGITMRSEDSVYEAIGASSDTPLSSSTA